MADSYSLTIGGNTVALQRSRTQVAVRANAGMARSLDHQLRSIAAGSPVERSGQLGGFEIVDIRASAAEVAAARDSLRGAASVSHEAPVYHTSDDGVPFVPVGTIYLGFDRQIGSEAQQSILDRHGLELVVANPDRRFTVRVARPGLDSVEVAQRLQQEPGVTVAEPDLVTTKRTQALALDQDELLARQWHLRNTGTHNGISLGFTAGADARVVAAWNVLGDFGSSDVTVGIIDDGFDLSHPDLADKAVSPWDFARNSSDVSPQPNPAAPEQGDWHGTACAGVAVGKARGGQIIGAAPSARLIPIRMTRELSPVQVAQWFDYMTDKGAWVVSCSWGAEAAVYPLPQRVADAIARCARDGRQGRGCVVVFAAGNSGKNVNDPPNFQNGFATHPDVVVVAASTSRDTHADYSNFGNEISICAPSGGLGGWNIITSDVRGTYIDSDGVERSSGYADGDYNLNFTGTSSACPLVAGVAALVLSANPLLTSAEVREVLKSTARKIGPAGDYANGHSVRFGHGCIDADSAVQEAVRRGSHGVAVATSAATEAA